MTRLLRKLINFKNQPPHKRLKMVRLKTSSIIHKILEKSAGKVLVPPVSPLFHFAYYHNSETWTENRWFGAPIQQFPSDLYIYQEIIAATRPDYIVQTGVFDGGSALFLAQMLDLAEAPASALVVAIDIELHPKALELTHPRIRLIEGSSTAPETLGQIEAYLATIPPVNGGMVSLDSDHSERHVAGELKLYPRFVGVGNYLVVEDTTVNGRPVYPHHGPGPGEALDKWLPNHPEFEADNRIWQRHFFSAHAGGWLKRVA